MAYQTLLLFDIQLRVQVAQVVTDGLMEAVQDTQRLVQPQLSQDQVYQP
jgi:hypothetical protein